MGFLNNSTVTVDAVLTKKGRELLAKGQGEFKITKFALSDDGIDYGLYDTTHPDGTEQYGSAILNMPLVEAIPDEKQVMRYKLVTLPKTTTSLPVVSLTQTSITLTRKGQSVVLSPSTSTSNNDGTLGYTAILHNSDAGTFSITRGGEIETPGAVTAPVFLSDAEEKASTTVIGTQFKLVAKQTSVQIKTQITIIGNETGGTLSIPVTVNANV